jgi:hypothetical protein
MEQKSSTTFGGGSVWSLHDLHYLTMGC